MLTIDPTDMAKSKGNVTLKEITTYQKMHLDKTAHGHTLRVWTVIILRVIY